MSFLRNEHWKMELHFTPFSTVYGTFKIFLHNKNDLPSALYSQANLNFQGYFDNTRLVLTNVDSSKQSTSANPCRDFWPKECHENKRNKEIEDKFRLV